MAGPIPRRFLRKDLLKLLGRRSLDVLNRSGNTFCHLKTGTMAGSRHKCQYDGIVFSGFPKFTNNNVGMGVKVLCIYSQTTGSQEL